MFTKRITVFTPTYNRAYIIQNLYESLKRQTYMDFEWLVVDDGSTDNTNTLFEEWMNKDTAVTIRYYKTNNGGKHRAVNYALDLADGEIFFVVDSDDYLTDDALEKVNMWFQSIEGMDYLVGIAANKGSSTTETVNPLFQTHYLDKSLLEMNSYMENGKKVIGGERALCFYTEFHRKYRYPEFEGERFETEAVVYNRMAHDGFKTRFFNDIIWIYEYKQDGLTQAGTSLFLNNPYGYGLWLREKAKFSKDTIFQQMKMEYTFTCDLADKYSLETISECISAPIELIKLYLFLHKLISRFRR